MAWYEMYDFSEDPFTDPDKVYGMEKVVDDLAYRVESGSMAYVEGRPGSGKSIILRKLIESFGGKGKIVYFDCGQMDRRVNIEALMKGKYGFFGSMFGKVPKNMILLLDNANRLSKKNCEKIKYYFDNNFVKSVVFTGSSYSKAHFSQSLRDRIGGRVIKLKDLTPEQAVLLVKDRAPDLKMLPEDIIKKIYKLSGNNVKQFLAHLSAVLERAASEGADKVSEKHVKEVFGGNEK